MRKPLSGLPWGRLGKSIRYVMNRFRAANPPSMPCEKNPRHVTVDCVATDTSRQGQVKTRHRMPRITSSNEVQMWLIRGRK